MPKKCLNKLKQKAKNLTLAFDLVHMTQKAKKLTLAFDLVHMTQLTHTDYFMDRIAFSNSEGWNGNWTNAYTGMIFASLLSL